MMETARRRSPRLALAALAALAVTVAGVGVAAAHVTVDPPEAPQGGSVELAFRIPGESSTASTTKVDLKLPDGHPLATVAVKPHPGWTYTTVSQKLAAPIETDDGTVSEVVSQITWTATGDGIKPGEFDDFAVEVGPLPTDTTSLVFKVVQTYGDGSESAWIELPTPGGPEPEHPAPTLTLTPAEASTPGSTAPADSSAGTAATSTTAGSPIAPSSTGGDGDGNGLAIAALVAAVVGIALGGLALARSRRAGSA